MRWIALFLLAVNAGLIVWQLGGAPGAPGDEVVPPPEVGQLALLREPADEPDDVEDDECYSIGPFSDETAAKQAGEYLTELGTEPERRLLTDQETTGYQVILPPFPSIADAQEATRELEREGIQDYFIITEEGEYDNAISLGMFSERDFALDHQAHLEEQGFEPELRLRTRERERYWQDYRDPGGLVDVAQLEAWAGEGPLQRLPRGCD